MKTLSTLLRHWFTFAAGTAVAMLTAWLTLSPEDVQKLGDAFGLLVEPLIVIVTIVGIAVARLLQAKAGELFRRGAGETEGTDSAGGVNPCWVGLAMGTTAVMGLLPSCSSSSGDWPVTGTLSYRDPQTGAKAAFSYSPAKRLQGGVTVPIYDVQTGELLGVTDVRIGKSAK